ncbi:GNAT family N-acetyltransferase [Tetragenococcus koreensis]|uniref:N-acetyltransferase domain-containing protein n=1 Tax=Tetragenococcus koreensis TaxID=290335 RepID=A0AAN4UA32_9ENTE|nr:GNAT family N-acetyltransferase [Tetragenococcus koreensis]GEN92183.1 hypothetical protein TKO01_22290 [Tetragenococcus koreensis]GEQ48209.1 hypothetical protein TK11N_00610 [Tetragenococcus koreensis]GEQ50722.1 hypothetical protein TK12N_00660 [Tetragenococcus koreensis]GEQ53217.1 hypothetical protein TK2N_00610 [Tetragenococcus koreensis]GEQ55723.1 hypothetical protein TK4N_00660 [Tetragenococcus koreensis]
MENIGTIRLQTKRLLLRPLTTEDAQQMFDHWASNPKVTKHLSWKPYQTAKGVENNLSEYQKNYIDPDYFSWGIEEQKLNNSLVLSQRALLIKQPKQPKLAIVSAKIGGTTAMPAKLCQK